MKFAPTICLMCALLGAEAALNDEDRRLGAILGAVLMDSAAMPLHWIYDTASIQSSLGKGTGRKDAAFFSPPSCPFYRYPEGENSPYGQQFRLILNSLATAGGLKPTLIQDAYWSYYGSPTGACHQRQNFTSHVGCYWDGSTKGFVANYEAGLRWPKVGANDTQANALVHMVPLVAALAGRKAQSEMLKDVETLIRVTQNTDDAAAFGLAGARILALIIQGTPPKSAVSVTAKILQNDKRVPAHSSDKFLANGLENVLQKLDQPNFDVVQEVGQACDFPYNLWGGSHLVAQITSGYAVNGTQTFMLGARQTIEAGGDSASRGTFVGAMLGAVAGESGLPAAWMSKYLHYDKVLADARTLLRAGVTVV